MKLSSSKSIATLISVILMLTIAVSLVAMPSANAHTPTWTITPVAYCFAAPTPCGVGQVGLIYGWLNYVIGGASITNDIRFEN
jgi:hypothetical protein